MKYWLLYLSLFSVLIIKAQVKHIKGIVYDDYTGYHVKNVRVHPSLSTDTVFTTEKGRFEVILPKKFRDTIVFTHPDYYPFVKRVYVGDAVHLQIIRLIPRTFVLDTICHLAFDNNLLLNGSVNNFYNKKPVVHAEIRLENNLRIAYTDAMGNFEFVIPESNKNLIFSHPDFNTKVMAVNSSARKRHLMQIWLTPKFPEGKDTSWSYRKNVVGLSVNELLNGAIGMRYERILKQKHAIGLHLTDYYFGFAWPMIFGGMTNDRFTGVKVAPFYHYYFWRNPRQIGFSEVKALFSYLNFSKLDYSYNYEPEDEYTVSGTFTSWGFGLSWGWMFFPFTNNFVISLSVGVQYMPWSAPKQVMDENGAIYEIDKTWWYVGGPGSVIEIKIVVGGIF